MVGRTALPVAALAVVLLLVGCSNNSGQDEPDVAASEEVTGAPAETDPLTRGLQAHVDGDLDAAVSEYETALETDPENKLALYNLGLVRQSQGDNAAAEENYRATLEVDPDYTPALFNLAILRSAAGDNAEAVELYERVVAIETDNAGAHLNLGFALRELGREKEAQQAFDRAVELDPALEDRIEG